MKTGGIVLCGGRSVRMGRPKLSLPVGEELMLQRVVRILSEAVSPIAVVAAPDQELPPLPGNVLVVRDEQEGLGPLAGISTGLQALQSQVDAAYVSACDVPLLRAEFVRGVIERLEDFDLAMPRDERFHHPLSAVYRTSLSGVIQQLLSAGERRPMQLVEQCQACCFDVRELTAVDPSLDSLQNINTPEDYARALAKLRLSSQ